jgi:hypothetical protein
MIEVGKAYRGCFNRGTSYKLHVLAIIEGHVMFKYYGKYKQGWHYKVTWMSMFELYLEIYQKYGEE